MFIKLFIISGVIIAIFMLSIGIKKLFKSKAEFAMHSCELEENEPNKEGSCNKCELKDLADCTEKKKD